MFTPVIGLEVHIQLNTKSGMFCSCSTDIWQKEPNSVTCPVCLGLPGALPVPNKVAIEKCQLLGLALGCTLNRQSKFDRKNYFYPDLPKGYQISQYDQPFCLRGSVDLSNKKIRIRRVHLEEDTGKSIHEHNQTLLDFNKSGTPLAEVVTEPDMSSSEEAVEFCKKLVLIAKLAGVTNADMERGNVRLEANISLRKEGQTDLPDYRVEVKNINSFKFLKDAIDYEIARQTEILEKDQKVVRETRGYNSVKKITFTQRVKETESDYRYFPEPDIPPMEFSEEYIAGLKKRIVSLGLEEKLGLNSVFSNDLKLLELLEELVSLGMSKNIAENILINKKEFRSMSAQEILKSYKEGTENLVEDRELLMTVAKKVISENPKVVEEYRKGRQGVLQFLIGQMMKETKGKANPKLASEVLSVILAKS